MAYQSNDINVLIYRIILIICFGILTILSTYKMLISFYEYPSPNREFIRFMLIFIIFSCICMIYLGEIIVFLQAYLNLQKVLFRIIINLPCSNLTMMICRISYLLFIIYLDLNQKFDLKTKEKLQFCLRDFLYVYCFINYSSRIIVACFDDQSWLIYGSSNQSLACLSLFYSGVSVSILLYCSFAACFSIKKVMKNSIGNKIKKNLTILTCVMLLIIICYWASTIYGRFFFNDYSKNIK